MQPEATRQENTISSACNRPIVPPGNADVSEPNQRRAPGQTAAKRLQQYQLATLYAPVRVGLSKGQRDRRRGGVGMSVDGHHDPFAGQPEFAL